MKKLKLHLEDLRIDSFQTTSAEKPKGTVFGEQCTCYTQCTCPGCPTCDASLQRHLRRDVRSHRAGRCDT